jgi:hypothetical protein
MSRLTGAERRENQANIRSSRNGGDTLVFTPGAGLVDPNDTSPLTGRAAELLKEAQTNAGPPVTAPSATKPTKPTQKLQVTETAPSKSKFTQKKIDPLRYPKAIIDADTDYLQINVLQYRALGFPKQKNILSSGLNRSKSIYKKEERLGSIILPIPQNISDSNSTGWGEDSINAVGAYAMGAYDTVANDPNFFQGIVNAVNTAGADIKNLASDASVKDALNSIFASSAANLVPGTNTSFNGTLARTSGQILNPNTELLFNGIKLRTFNFTFNLAPRSDDEALEIKKIIKILKTNMAPTTASAGNINGLFLKSPNVFQLEYKQGGAPHPYLNRFVVAALTNMQVNYTGSGTYATYNDGAPVHMIMTLSFQELSPVYAEEQEEAGGTGY